jgi:hypothetical protein
MRGLMFDFVVVEAQSFDDAGRSFREHVGVFDQPQQFASLGCFKLHDAAFVGVQQDEIKRIDARAVARCDAALVAGRGLFDLDDVGTQPGQGLGARCAGLELGQVDHAHARERWAGFAVARLHAGQCSAGTFSRFRKQAVACTPRCRP